MTSAISRDVPKPLLKLSNLTLAERQKRLLPYINFYVSQNLNHPQNDDYYQTNERYQIIEPPKRDFYQPIVQTKYGELIGTTYPSNNAYQTQQVVYRPKTKFTPFLESNALPGPFVPMVTSQAQKIKITYSPERIPNYSAIYDKLSQLKLQQNILNSQIPYKRQKVNNQQYIVRKPQINLIPVQEFQEPVPPEKTYIHTYTPTSIEVPSNEKQEYNVQHRLPIKFPQQSDSKQAQNLVVTQEPFRITQIHNPKQVIQSPIVINEQPVRYYNPQQNYLQLLTFNPRTQYLVQEQKAYHNQNHKQFLQEIVPNRKPIILIPQVSYTPNPNTEEIKATKPFIILQPTPAHNKHYQMEHITTSTYQPIVNIQPVPKVVETPINEIENPNSLSQILKKLQDSNALPHTLTPDNIDNSIKTLVKILNTLKKQQKLARPIIVADEEPDYEDHDNEAGVTVDDPNEGYPGAVTQTFPAHTPEGGTPGRAGIDYPALANIPPTNFNCKAQRYKGFFADPDTHCQVWHYCDLNGGQASFLCPNGTIFSQVALTCDWWFNVKCSTTTQLYVLNERLYKYIIPLSPKFPEDYTGPLVDRYLAIKFKEMEEKLQKEKVEEKPTNKSEEINEIEILQDNNTEGPSLTTTFIKNHTSTTINS